MKSLSRENQADIIEALNSTSRYLDDLLDIDNIYLMVDFIYSTELQLNTANSSDTEASFLDLNLCVSNVTVSNKIYEKRAILILSISISWMSMSSGVPHVVYTYLIRFARASSNLSDFNCCNKTLTAKLHRQGYRYFKLRKAFSKCYRRHSAMVGK